MKNAKKIKEEITSRFVDAIKALMFQGAISSELKFCESISLNNVSFSDMKSGKLQVGTHYISELLRIYPSVSAEWLISGVGSMFKMKNGIVTSDRPPGCDSCKEKERIISSMRETIETQESCIETLKRTLEILDIGPLSGQKRKALPSVSGK